MIDRPNLDEEKLQEMSRTPSLAIMDKRLVTLMIYTPYDLDRRTILTARIDVSTRPIKGYSALGERVMNLPLDEVVDVVLLRRSLMDNKEKAFDVMHKLTLTRVEALEENIRSYFSKFERIKPFETLDGSEKRCHHHGEGESLYRVPGSVFA